VTLDGGIVFWEVYVFMDSTVKFCLALALIVGFDLLGIKALEA